MILEWQGLRFYGQANYLQLSNKCARLAQCQYKFPSFILYLQKYTKS